LKRSPLWSLFAAAGVAVTVACAQAQVPVQTIDPQRHGNLAAA
jgi:hypothetical protein